jgi:hypothetical protein
VRALGFEGEGRTGFMLIMVAAVGLRGQGPRGYTFHTQVRPDHT